MEESKMEYIEEVREAYERTLKFAADAGAEDFRCGSLPCSHCPFITSKGGCDEDGVLRTVAEWQQWWYEQTGERDTRTVKEILTVKGWQQTEETVEETVQPTEDTTDTTHTEDSTDTSGEDVPQPVEPTVSIVWNTAVGKIENHTGTMSLLSSEIGRFNKELSVWLECINRPVDRMPNSLVDYISFIATAQDGAIVCKCQLFADQFGKRKVWESTGW